MARALLKTLGLASVALAAAAVAAQAQIVRLDLRQMVARTDGAIVGKITAKKVIRVDDEKDGPDLYFTRMTIEGRSLVNGAPLELVVTYGGGWIDPEHGVDNSEAPTADETRLGNEVVAFYKWSDNMGGQVSGNALYAWHGGLYRVASGQNGKVVLGKGEGFAVSSNVALDALDSDVTRIHDELRQQGGK